MAVKSNIQRKMKVITYKLLKEWEMLKHKKWDRDINIIREIESTENIRPEKGWY